MVSSERKKIAVGCQGGGMHAAFEVGVLTEILKDCEKKKFELVGLSGTSAGALCALMVWYGLAPKKNGSSSVGDTIRKLERFWEDFVANTGAETVLNFLTYGAFWAEETEIPVLGINAPIFGLNPAGAFYKAIARSLPHLGVRKQYFDFKEMFDKHCPDFGSIKWEEVKTRLLIGASEVVNGLETVFDSEVNKKPQSVNQGMQKGDLDYWHQQLPLTLSGVAASGTLPSFREAQRIEGGYYWDGLYSQNPPVREFLNGVDTEEVPDELWIVRINPQRWPEQPKSNAETMDRENELMGNLSLHKELDFIMAVNKWRESHKGKFADDYKHVIVRTIKMKEETADELRYSSKFDRSREFMDQLRNEGRAVARDWLDRWPDGVGCYPEDAAYR
jgi:NTE family protein